MPTYFPPTLDISIVTSEKSLADISNKRGRLAAKLARLYVQDEALITVKPGPLQN